MQSVIRIGLCELILCAALPQTPPDVAEILKKVSHTYRAGLDYELAGDLTVAKTATPGGSGRVFIAFKSPNRYRIEGAFRGLGLSDYPVIIHDGSKVWIYLPDSNQYASFPASELTGNAPGDLGDLRPAAMDHLIMWRYRDAKDFTNGSRFLREETIEFEGAKVDCYVVAVPQKGPVFTWWVDKVRSRVLREDNMELSTVFRTIKLGEPLPDKLFKFEPPAGSRRLPVP